MTPKTHAKYRHEQKVEHYVVPPGLEDKFLDPNKKYIVLDQLPKSLRNNSNNGIDLFTASAPSNSKLSPKETLLLRSHFNLPSILQ